MAGSFLTGTGVCFPDGTTQTTASFNTLIGPTVVYACAASIYCISNYDCFSTYTICSTTGFVCRSNNCLITYPYQGYTCHYICVNGRAVGVQVCIAAACQIEYICPGSYTWIAPTGVGSVSVVAVGPGAVGVACCAGGGGGLGWRCSIPVTPGCSYTIQVGSVICPGCGACPSYFQCASTIVVCGGSGAILIGGCWCGDCGGRGGQGGVFGGSSYLYQGGGGGAGGYCGNGGAGGQYSSAGACGSGGGGGGGAGGNGSFQGAMGGGVGIYGLGCSGNGGNCGNGCIGSPACTGCGCGGSASYYGYGGKDVSGYAMSGAVRIVWGSPGCCICRFYPCTCTYTNC